MKFILCFIAIVFVTAVNSPSYALGNHPESNLCPNDKPYFVFCSHSLHNLEGWYGSCYATQELAEQAVQAHADEQHKGNSRWTGVRKLRDARY